MQTIWLWLFVSLYAIYCVYWGYRGMRLSTTANEYMIASRQLPLWVFVLAATATSFSAFTFVGHPGLIYVDGLQYAHTSFYAIVIPFAGLLFLKRQWLLGKAYGFITPGEMFGTYYRSDTIRLLVVLVALIFSVPYLGVQLRASGFLFHILTDGALGINAGMLLLSAIVLIYVISGGLRAVAYVGSLQAVLLAVGIVVLGIFTLNAVGGLGSLTENAFLLGQLDENRTPAGYSHYIAIPGVIQWVSSGTEAQGGAWTAVMNLTFMFAVLGIQSSPAFTMWAFASQSPKAFAPQQVWASSLVIGLILLLFSAAQGIGSHFIGADLKFLAAHPEAVNNILGNVLANQDLMESTGSQNALVARLIQAIGETTPWLVGLLAVCALAAMQSTGAAYMSTAGTILTRDLIKLSRIHRRKSTAGTLLVRDLMARFIRQDMSDAAQKNWARIFILVVVALALLVAITSTDALVLLGDLALSFGFQMWPALIGICYWPWLTRLGITIGLICGLIVVVLTGDIGVAWFGIEAWGRWPLTLHSAFWGMLFNLPIAVIVSYFTQTEEDTKHQQKFQDFLSSYTRLPDEHRRWIPLAWLIAIGWFFFAVGPGAVIGNGIFGNPNDMATWFFGIPSLRVWQIVWWFLGVGMMWFLAYKMQLATFHSDEASVKPMK